MPTKNEERQNKSAPIRPQVRTVDGESQSIVRSVKKSAIRRPRAKAVRKKKTFAESVASMLIGEAGGVGSYLFHDILIPAAKSTVQEFFSTGLEMLLYGSVDRSERRSERNSSRTVVSYDKFYGRGRRDERPRHGSARFNLDEVFFNHGPEAEAVLDGLCDILEEYRQVTVADFFELAGVEGQTWIHRKWGWEDLSKAYFQNTRDGWIIVFPDPIELN